MKALQLVQPRRFDSIDAPLPDLGEPGSEKILARTRWVSLCGSDIPFFTGAKRHITYPLPPGAPIHECVGQVVDSASSRFQPGDWVIAIPEGDQALSEYFVAQSAKAIPLPPEVADLPESCLIQPLSTVMNALDRLGDLAGRSVAVVGLGSAGLFFCWLLVKRGAGRITGIDPCEERCRFAQALGVNMVYPLPTLELVHHARTAPRKWEAPEIIIEAVGHQMETLNDCLELAKPRGVILAYGVPDTPVYALEFERFFRKNLTLIASVTPLWQDYLERARGVFVEHQAELANWVTHHFSIREAQTAFSLYAEREDHIIKGILDAADWG